MAAGAAPVPGLVPLDVSSRQGKAGRWDSFMDGSPSRRSPLDTQGGPGCQIGDSPLPAAFRHIPGRFRSLRMRGAPRVPRDAGASRICDGDDVSGRGVRSP